MAGREEEPRGTPERRPNRHEQHLAQTYALFLRELEERGVDKDLAPKAIESVLCALEQRLVENEGRHLEAQLPKRVQALLQRCPRHLGRPPRKLNRDEFLEMVASDLGCDLTQAEGLTRAVFSTVREHISEGEAEDVAIELPLDLRTLWAPYA
ncbi:DUF2267 domain-containing protein [Myxococcaceae bacterium GXIMD 01537]